MELIQSLSGSPVTVAHLGIGPSGSIVDRYREPRLRGVPQRYGGRQSSGSAKSSGLRGDADDPARDDYVGATDPRLMTDLKITVRVRRETWIGIENPANPGGDIIGT